MFYSAHSELMLTRLLIAIGLTARCSPTTDQPTATYLVERSVKEFNHVVELATLASKQVLVMAPKVG